jgi:hypothetical protein
MHELYLRLHDTANALIASFRFQDVQRHPAFNYNTQGMVTRGSATWRYLNKEVELLSLRLKNKRLLKLWVCRLIFIISLIGLLI